MKKIHKLFPVALGLLASVFLILSSCNKMDDIQRKYAEKEEQVYLGKVDSLMFFPGLSRTKLTWYISSDPRIDRTVIYWNLRRDSIVKDFNRTDPGVQKDSILIDNLPEGTTLFEFRNVNNEGETSLYSSISATVWGSAFAAGLRARKVTAFDFDYSQSLYNLTLSPISVGDSVVYSQIIYTNTHGEEKTVRIERDTANVVLADFPDGGEFRFRTVFFLNQGIDTIYNDYTIFKAPKAVFERGTKISFVGNIASKYFDQNGENLYEWNASGDLIVYALNVDGSLVQTNKFPSIVPRSTYRDFFFYDNDKFIGISTGNAASMFQIVGGGLTFVKTPAGSNTLGTGFTYQQFIPTKGLFFSMTAGTGNMITWLAQDNATWGIPNGTTVGTGFTIYNPLMMFNNQSLLGVDGNGYLWNIPVSVSGTIGTRSRIGSGWNRFKKMISVGTTLFCMEMNGDFYVFNNFNTVDKFWIVN